VTRDLPLLTIDLARRLERLVAPEPTLDGRRSLPGDVMVAPFGRTIAAKSKTRRPSNKVFCFNQDDVARLDEILAFYAMDDLEPTFSLTPAGFTRDVAAALAGAGFSQHEFEQAMLYGLPSTELSSPPRHIAIERVTAETLEAYAGTAAAGFEMPPAWWDAAIADVRSRFTSDDHRFMARIDGEPAAVATLRTREGVASLGGAATIPHFRGRGCHLALLRHRLDVAYLLGCTLVSSGASFGSGSFRNQLRAGLRLAYIESGWRRGEIR
jgi:hypothetical protein